MPLSHLQQINNAFYANIQVKSNFMLTSERKFGQGCTGGNDYVFVRRGIINFRRVSKFLDVAYCHPQFARNAKLLNLFYWHWCIIWIYFWWTKSFGGSSEAAPPVPIPNTEVKRFSADDTAPARRWENRSLPEGFFLLPQDCYRINTLPALNQFPKGCMLWLSDKFADWLNMCIWGEYLGAYWFNPQ